MGKVASFGVYDVLKKDGFSVAHFHFLSSAIGFFTADSKLWQTILALRSSVICLLLNAYIKLSRKDYKIITLTRDPVARNISLLFQQFHHLLKPMLLDKRAARDLTVTELSETKLLELIFFDKINQSYPVQWFDKELNKIFGIDVYSHPFEMEKGYSVIRKGRISVLVLRSENLSDQTDIIREFTGDNAFEPKGDNRGMKKWYGEMYKRFLENFSPTEEYLDELYNSRYMRHFYTDDMITEFKKKWMKTAGGVLDG
jgi:hypothetical protein